ncbi:hypothetical protein TIFTF001_023553 [Ficus carica]|uniref:Uncharacterized protein n=1 Tax=Ficus carica TaxID=3494 RepID=A0AA88DK74_FICCA|nr:hypothetical protein TIFTF001_023553 [Ficus carica]
MTLMCRTSHDSNGSTRAMCMNTQSSLSMHYMFPAQVKMEHGSRPQGVGVGPTWISLFRRGSEVTRVRMQLPGRKWSSTGPQRFSPLRLTFWDNPRVSLVGHDAQLVWGSRLGLI